MELRDPIFILGVMPRSGTNFLWHLLRLHPHCAPARSPITEDFFLEHSEHLLAFATAVQSSWDPVWGEFEDDLMDRLSEFLGDGLISFLWVDHSRRLITKSPSVINLGRFFTFFPHAQLLLLVRDGRSVVQSCVATFRWDFETVARQWAAAVDQIRQFEVNNERWKHRYRIVRYEDLVDDLDSKLPVVLDFLGLDRDLFDFDQARRLPVRGSSVYFGQGRDAVHWEPVEKDPSFAFKDRWREWNSSKLQRFEWIAGEQLRYLGYPSSGLRKHGHKAVRHHTLDLSWTIKSKGRFVFNALKRRMHPRARSLRRWLGLIHES